MQKPTDEETLRGLKNQEAAAYRILYRSCYPAVEKFVLRNKGTQADARDVFQDAMVVLWQQTAREDPRFMQSSIFTSPKACPLPPAMPGSRQTGFMRYVKNFLLFFFRFGLCPLCITASVGYGMCRLFKRLFSPSTKALSHAKNKL